jgi:hypothetical protein
MRILEAQLEFLPIGLRLSTDRTVNLVIQSRERAPRLTLILIYIRAASSDLTSESAVSTQSRNGGCTEYSRER